MTSQVPNLTDLKREAASFKQQGTWHLVGGLILVPLGVIGMMHCNEISQFAERLVNLPADVPPGQAGMLVRIPYALVVTLLMSLTSMAPLMIGIMFGIWFGLVILIGGK